MARTIAINYRGLLIVAAHIFAAVTTLEMCREMGAEQVEAEPAERRQGVVVVDTWAGRLSIEGLPEVVAPAVDAIRTSNRIEAAQNHKAWDDLPERPEDYR